MNPKKTYLGDGVYASFDGWMIWLTLDGQDSTTRIALEPQVLHALKEFEAEVFKTNDSEERSSNGNTKND